MRIDRNNKKKKFLLNSTNGPRSSITQNLKAISFEIHLTNANTVNVCE